MKSISVIIPIFNTEKYLRDCINSVINQTIKNIEIICVNDGSTDSSLSILNEFSSIDDRVIVISQANKGMSAARNVGLKKATGEYIAFMDSDDWYVDNSSLEKLYSIAKEEQLDDVFFEAEFFYEEGVAWNRSKDKTSKKYGKNAIDYGDAKSGQELFCEQRKHKNYRSSVCRQMYRRDFLDSNGITFYEGIKHEDELFTIQCMTLANKVKCVNIPAYGRRFRAGSIMTSEVNDLSRCWGYLNVYKQMLVFGEKHIENFSQDYLEEYCKRISAMKSLCVSMFYKINQERAYIELSKFDKGDKLLFLQFKQEYDELEKVKTRRKKLEKSLEYRMGVKLLTIPRVIQKKVKKGASGSEQAK